jgi:hypothetical protein
MRSLPFALLVFLPFSTAPATPPPAGFEERVQLRAELTRVEERIELQRKTLVSRQSRVQYLEMRLKDGDERGRRELDGLRRTIQQRQRILEEDEEEVARIKRRLGITP